MDKSLIKIQELEMELENLTSQINEMEQQFELNKIKQNSTEERIDYLERNLKFAESQKKDYMNIKKNMKKNKHKSILKTLLLSFSIFLTIFAINNIVNVNLIVNLILILFGLKQSLSIWKSSYYYSNKKYLETHNLAQLIQKIVKYEKELSIEYEKQNNLRSEVIEQSNEEAYIIEKVKLIKNEIENLKNSRTKIINEYIESNHELEELLNDEYEKQKTLVK